MGYLTPTAVQWIKKYDSYRISEVEVWAHCSFLGAATVGTGNSSVVLYVAEDMDTLNGESVIWAEHCNRENLKRIVFGRSSMSQKVGTYKPRPTFKAAEGSFPQNVVPRPDTWIDAGVTSQQFAGLNWYAACPFAVNPGQGDYAFTIDFEIRVMVEVTGTI